MEKLLNNLEKRWLGAFTHPSSILAYSCSESQGDGDYPCMHKWQGSRSPVHHRINTRQTHLHRQF